jgi:hypothetical protein
MSITKFTKKKLYPKSPSVGLKPELYNRLAAFLDRNPLSPSIRDVVSVALSEWLDREEAGK